MLNLSIWAILFLPLVAAIFGLFVSSYSSKTSIAFNLTSIFLAFMSTIFVTAKYTDPIRNSLWSFLDLTLEKGAWKVDLAYYIDPITIVMLLLITGIGLLVHLYSLEYMADDPDKSRFFNLLNLFIATMLLLVMADDLVCLLIGWAGVGFASYALIGFWYEKPSAVLASRKAFLINVIGDVGLMLAAAVAVTTLQTTSLSEMSGLSVSPTFCLWFGGFLLVGAFAKSAQMPLHVWLPDAMEGPTPVSALLHAATMVTAGVYLVARCEWVFLKASGLSAWLTFFAACSSFIAATAALTVFDLKRILAYSTMSQVGYMFMALGAGSSTIAMYHLFTHGFFKALLFLAAGLIIHHYHSQDIRDMTQLWSRNRFLAILFGVGSFALAGVPGFAGYFSKELILRVLSGPQTDWRLQAAFILASLTAMITALYVGRMFFSICWGEEEGSHYTYAPNIIGTTVCALLAVGSFFAGFPLEESFFNEFTAVDSLGIQIFSMEPTRVEHFITIAIMSILGFSSYWFRQPNRAEFIQESSFWGKLFSSCWMFDKFFTDMTKVVRSLALSSYEGLVQFFTDGVSGVFGGGILKLSTQARMSLRTTVSESLISIGAGIGMVLMFYYLLWV